MKACALIKNGVMLIDKVEMALSLGQRLKGLLGRRSYEAGCAMYLAPCGSIHTFFMKFNIDAVFLDRSMKVLRIVRNIGPGRMVFGGIRAYSVIELKAGWFVWSNLEVGDKISLATTVQ